MSCDHKRAFWSPLYAVSFPGAPTKKRFGAAPQCEGCLRLADYRLDKCYGDPLMADIQKAFNGTSWALMLAKNIKAPGCALNFELVKGKLTPENYTPPQTEIDLEVEPPF